MVGCERFAEEDTAKEGAAQCFVVTFWGAAQSAPAAICVAKRLMLGGWCGWMGGCGVFGAGGDVG